MNNISSNSILSSGSKPSSEDGDSLQYSLSSLLLPECTSTTFGNVKIKQEGYTCSFCDPNNRIHLCAYCYEKCHAKCREGQSNQYKRMYSREKSKLDSSIIFACECGLILKHMIKPRPKEEFSPCQLCEIDKELVNKHFFYCEEDKMRLCSVCYFICHKNCSNKHKYITSDNNSDFVCECKYNNHNIYNEFTFKIPLLDYQNEMNLSFYLIQLINTLFNTGTIFDQFIKLIKVQLSDKKNEIVFGKDHPFPYLLEQFSNIFNRKFKTYHYHEKILEMFPMESVIEMMRRINPKTKRMYLVKFRLMFILLFVHVKRDFSQLKTLTSNDFFCYKIIERLKYKKYIHSNNVFTKDLNEKYKNKILINEALDDFVPFMEMGIQKHFLNILEFQDELEIGLKYVSFLLKHTMFSKTELESLVRKIYNLHDRFIFGINLKDKSIFQNWLDIFQGFVEIFYLIIINYNDQVIESCLQEKNFNKINFDGNTRFIQSHSEHGELLFKMIIKNFIVVTKHYNMLNETPQKSGDDSIVETSKDDLFMKKYRKINPNGVIVKLPKEGILGDKILKLFNESWKMFALTDNSYYEQIQHITDDEIISYYNYEKELKEIEIKKNKPYTYNNVYWNVKKDIEKYIDLFFMSASNMQSNRVRDQLIDNITQSLGLIFNEINETNSTKPSFSQNPDIHCTISTLTNYKNQIIKTYIKPFIQSINSNDTLYDVTKEILLSNVIDTLTEILVIFSNKRYPKLINEEIIKLCFAVIGMLFLTKEGIKNFFFGKTFTRINKLFRRYRLNSNGSGSVDVSFLVLRFIFHSLVSSEIYGIDLTNDKILHRVKKEVIAHIEEFKNRAQSESLEFKTHLQYSLKIFNIINKYFSACENKEINNFYVKLFLDNSKNPLWSIDGFYEFYNNDLDDKGVPISISSRLGHKNHDGVMTTNIIDTEEKKDLLIMSDNKTRNTRISLVGTGTGIPTDLNSGTNSNPNIELSRVDNQIVFSFFELISRELYYVDQGNYESYRMIYDFFGYDDMDDKVIIKLFRNDKLTVTDKIILVKVFRNFCFISRIFVENQRNIVKAFSYISSNDYLTLLKENKLLSNLFPSISTDFLPNKKLVKTTSEELKIKYDIINHIETFCKLIVNELNVFPLNLVQESSEKIFEYASQLVVSVKILSDFFYCEKSLWNKPLIKFYDLAIAFLPKVDLIVKVILSSYDSNFILADVSTTKLMFGKELGLAKMVEITFDVFNRNEIYKEISKGIDFIFTKTNINSDFCLLKFLDRFDNAQEANFTPFALLEVYDYEYFYQTGHRNHKRNKTTFSEIVTNQYTNEFLDISKTNFLYVMQGLSSETNKINYRKKLAQFFISYLDSLDIESNKICGYLGSNRFSSLICFITKTMYYDTEEMQSVFKQILTQSFFEKIIKVLNQNLHLTLYSCCALDSFESFFSEAILTKLTLQFIQLLGEDFNTFFHSKIFKSSNDNLISIFHFVCLALKKIIMLLGLSDSDSKREMPYDKLIVLLSNLVEFIIEYSVTKRRYEKILEKEIQSLLFEKNGILYVMNLNSSSNMICFVKVKIIKLLITYLQNGKKFNTIKKMIEFGQTPVEFFEEIMRNYNYLLSECEKKIPDKVQKLRNVKDPNTFVNDIIQLYIYESAFRDSFQLRVMFLLFLLIRIYETKYNKSELANHFNKMEVQKNVKMSHEISIYSPLALGIYKFCESIIISVEVKTDGVNDYTEEKINYDDDVEEINENENMQVIFFIRPYLTYFISKQTKSSFETNVDRDSASTKYSGLLSSNDYFLFEMVANRNLSSGNKYTKFLSDIDYYNFEILNFLLICLHNIFLIIHHYRSWTLPEEEYEMINKDEFYVYETENLLLSIIQFIYILIVLIIWFKFKFCLYFMKYSLAENNSTFIFRKKNDLEGQKISKNKIDFFQNNNSNIFTIIKEQNASLSLMNKFYICVIDSVLINKEICVLVWNMIFIILYLVVKSSLFLVLPTLFVANISPTLFAIFKAIKTKWFTLVTILLFTYLMVYIFMWITYYFLPDNFIFEDVFDIRTGNEIKESFCYSTVQCWMFIVNYGVRAGGGIADALGKISFRTDHNYFVLRFFYDMLFHLLVVLILLNVFLGIIVDAFAELRNLNWTREKDMNNICFICQMSRDDCITKNIDFDTHVNKVHSLWNYVYFITSLHLENAMDFNRIKKYVWDKLGAQDYSWLPLEKGNY